MGPLSCWERQSKTVPPHQSSSANAKFPRHCARDSILSLAPNSRHCILQSMTIRHLIFYSSAFLFFISALAEEPINFNRDIRPLLSDRCFHCHGPDAKKREAALRLDTREGALAPLDDDGEMFTVVPGDPDKSELFYRIITDDEIDVMPPPESKLPAFSKKEIALIKRWIEEGANYSDLWTFVPVKRPEVPQGEIAKDWATNKIDHFVARKLVEENLKPSPEADRRTLIRRASLDLTGLPPMVEEVDAFLADKDPNAFEKVVDRLLASDAYGERMAVEWLDAARYADTSGYQYDWFRTMWRWRDWVIESYNDNQPYDEFITWQLAGDLLPDATLEQKIATGFNRNHPFTIEGGVIQEEYRVSYVSDRVTTMGTVFMGMTFECARCHDHKFDPVSQKDFYQLYAFFNHLPEKGQVGGKPLYGPPAIPAPTEEQTAELDRIEKDRKAAEEKLMRPDPAIDAKQQEWEKQSAAPWKQVDLLTITSPQKTEFESLGDNSWLAKGEAPAHDVYELTFDTAEAVTGVRIEALTHESMVGKGPGRSSNGNAVLTGMEAAAIGADGVETPIALSKAVADYEQSNFPAAKAIDDDPKSGWAFDGNSNHSDHWIAVAFDKVIAPETGKKVRVRLRFGSQYAKHSFGRVRLSVSGTPEPLGWEKDSALTEILEKAPGKRNAKEKDALRRAFRGGLPAFAEVSLELSQLEKAKEKLESEIPMTMIMSDDSPRETFILERGAYDKPLEKVTAGVPENLPPLPDGAEANRLGLAKWLTKPNHPLTARVAMNWMWHQVFGVGIVKTVNDFGSQAEWPTHPELLDWLAAEFVESGWDRKAMHKMMILSSTYRQSSNTSSDLMDRDPDNRLLARGPRNRLSAEMVRDQFLAMSGLLIRKVGGPSVKPYQPPGIWKELTNRKNFQQVYEADEGEGLYRRGLYTFWKRAAHHPMMSTFDAPNREVCTFSRSATNTPLQALVLLHDPQFVEAARVLAADLLDSTMSGEGLNRVGSLIEQGYLTVLARPPSKDEMELMQKLFAAEIKAFQAAPEEAAKLAEVGDAPAAEGHDQAELAATTMLVRTLFNLSETITRH